MERRVLDIYKRHPIRTVENCFTCASAVDLKDTVHRAIYVQASRAGSTHRKNVRLLTIILGSGINRYMAGESNG